MTSHFRHLFLYAKGHYVKGNLMSDLRAIIAKACALEPNYVSTWDCYQILSAQVFPLLKSEHHFTELVMDLLRATTDDERCYVLLARMSTATVREGDKVVLDLGEADASVLPLKHPPKEARDGSG